MTASTPRRAARVLFVDGADRVLHSRGCDPACPDHRYRFAPGGALDAGGFYPTGLAAPLSRGCKEVEPC